MPKKADSLNEHFEDCKRMALTSIRARNAETATTSDDKKISRQLGSPLTARPTVRNPHHKSSETRVLARLSTTLLKTKKTRSTDESGRARFRKIVLDMEELKSYLYTRAGNPF